MSSDSTKMDASTEFDAVLAFAMVNGSCEARPGAHAVDDCHAQTWQPRLAAAPCPALTGGCLPVTRRSRRLRKLGGGEAV